MKIVVTLMDIDKAQNSKDEVQACPIYQACKRKFGEKLLGVSRRYIWLHSGKSYLLPREAVDYTIAFDRREEVKPIQFEVEEK